jgi:D-3-phosphoglycerate dehydrogenase
VALTPAAFSHNASRTLVLRTEPPVAPSLATLPNVIVTPHAAWYSEESEVQLRSTVAELGRDAVRL